MKAAPKKQIDWEAVEMQYRAGIRSLKEIGAEFDVSDAGIIKRAKRDGWQRDLKAKIQAKADAKVSESVVSAEVSAQTKLTEKAIVEANAQAIANVRISHRKDIQRARGIALSLLDELGHQTDNMPLYHQLAELLEAPDDKGVDKRNDLFNKVISLGSRSSTMKSLADSLKTLITLEREAFGIDEKGVPETPKTPEQINAELALLLKKAINANNRA